MKTSSVSNSRGAAKGFTLVEMLVTIAIIAVLAGISFGGLQYVRAKQANEQAKIQIALLSKGLEEYKLDTGDYPPAGTSNSLFTALYWDGASTTPPGMIYVSELDPDNNKQGWTTGTGAATTITDPWGQELVYRRPPSSMNPDFDLLSLGNDATEGTSDDIKNF